MLRPVFLSKKSRICRQRCRGACGLLQPSRKPRKTRKGLVLDELKVCSRSRNLDKGKEIHARLMLSGHANCDVYVAAALVDMYAKCGSMLDARKVFHGIEQPDVVLWTALIKGYADAGEAITALDLLARMKCEGCAPNSVTFAACLKACASLALKKDGSGRRECLERGKQLHSEIGCQADDYVRSSLINMYAGCGSMADARQVFDGMKQPSEVPWNALIMGYAENGEGDTALELYARMKSEGLEPNSFTMVAALKACTSLANLAECAERVRQIHSEMGCRDLDSYVQNTLIDAYAKSGCMLEACNVFDGMSHPDVVSWTALILGYAENGEGLTAFGLFARMRRRGCAPNAFTFVALLKACSSLAPGQERCARSQCLERVKQVHSEAGCHADIYVHNTLLDVYAKLGSMASARQVFDSIKHPDVVSWTALISGYAEGGESATALELFARMRSQGCEPNCFTFIAALKACSGLGALELGIRLHAEISSGRGVNAILVNSLTDFYAKCGCLVEAHKVFDTHPRMRNLITWNTLMAGYSRIGDKISAFTLFQAMQDAGVQPNGVTFLCLLTCCSHAGLLRKAKTLFEAMSANYGITRSIEHYNCMLDILGRSNKLDDVIKLLQSMPSSPDVVTWMTVLAACRKWKNADIGRLAFDCLVQLDEINAAAYVLMAQIYRSMGMWEEEEKLYGMRKELKARPGQSCWTSRCGEVHAFGSQISWLL